MNNYFLKLKYFWQRYKFYIIISAVVLIALNWNALFSDNKKETAQLIEQYKLYKEQNPDVPGNIKSYEEIMIERKINSISEQHNYLPTIVILIAALAFLIYYGRQKKWFSRFIKGKVRLTAMLFKEKSSGQLFLNFNLSNSTQHGETFYQPTIVFKLRKETKQFKIKSDSFPITLTTNTSHSMTINLNHFFTKIPELGKFKRVGIIINTSSGATFKSKMIFCRNISKHI